jgi:superkiller protein 3
MTQEMFEQHLALADSAAAQGDWPGAIAALRQADLIQPQQVGVLTALGTCLIQTGEMAEAVNYFEQVAQMLPDVFEAHNNLGVALTLDSQFSRAEQAFRRALEIDSENLVAWKNLAQVCLEQNDRLSEGVKILAAVVRSHPEDSGALVMMGSVYEETAQLDPAETYFRAAIKADPQNQDAVEGLRRVLELKPTGQAV